MNVRLILEWSGVALLFLANLVIVLRCNNLYMQMWLDSDDANACRLPWRHRSQEVKRQFLQRHPDSPIPRQLRKLEWWPLLLFVAMMILFFHASKG